MNSMFETTGVFRACDAVAAGNSDIFTTAVPIGDGLFADPSRVDVSYLRGLAQQPRRSQVDVNKNRKPFVPADMEHFVPYGDHRYIESIIKSKKFAPVLITGESGFGKSEMVMHIHAKLKRPMIRLAVNERDDQETLIGSKTLVEGNVQIQDGPFIIAMREGCTVLIDEISAADTNSIMCIQSIMEGGSYYYALTGEYITPKPGFNVIFTDNTKGHGDSSGKYLGVNILNGAFLNRIAAVFEHVGPTESVEFKIMSNVAQAEGVEITEDSIKTLIRWAQSTRVSYKAGAIDEQVSTRRVKQILTMAGIIGDVSVAIRTNVALFEERTRDALCELYSKMTAPKQDTPNPLP